MSPSSSVGTSIPRRIRRAAWVLVPTAAALLAAGCSPQPERLPASSRTGDQTTQPAQSTGATPSGIAKQSPSHSVTRTAPSTHTTRAAKPTRTTPASQAATAFVRLDPWNDGTAAQAPVRHAGADDNCIGSSVSNREDVARCFVGNGVLDPCFVRSREDRQAYCEAGSEKFRVTGVNTDELYPVGEYGEGSPFHLVLADGSTCDAVSGAGPQGAPGFPYWNGECRGATEGVWRSGGANEGSGKNSGLYPGPGAGGVWQVAVSVGEETSKSVMVDVAKATY